MSRFHRLAVARVERETRDAVAITFAVPEALADTFRYAAGQHLTLRADIGGQDVRRSYSICAAEQDATLRIAVKRCPGGVFSTWANESLKPGDTLEVMPPLGHFAAPAAGADAPHYAAFAAGSGITPLLSIVKTTLARQPGATFTLVYANRASSTVMFREELAALKDRYLARFNLVHVLSREAQDIELLHGRIDRAKADAILARWVPVDDIDAVYLCGPEGMTDAVQAALRARGVPEAKIRVERFAASIPKHTHVAPATPAAGRSECEVSATLDGVVRTFAVAKGTRTVLDAGLAAGVELPYSCKGGVCSTCRCRVVEGEVDMDVNFALEDYEVARGYVLACQSYPVTDRLVVTYDD
ncbi:MAG: 1,2-phenylacetyl-CoA epoxidase subunit PaaE [Burkholderiales bacterium]